MNKITAAQIKQWKQKYGEVHQMDVPVDDEGKDVAVGYFRKPSMETIQAVAKVGNSDPVKGGLVLFNHCWLGGDERFNTDDELKISAMKPLGALFRVRQASIKKL